MATQLPFVSVALLALSMIPTALSLQCYECTSHPQLVGGTSCSSDNVTNRTCHPFSDRCITVKAIISTPIFAPLHVERRNCTLSQVCDPQFAFNPCKRYGNRSSISNCTFDCCRGDLCNTGSTTSMPTTSAVSSTPSVVQSTPSVAQSTTSKRSRAVLGIAANLGAILSALVLPKIVRIN